MPLVVVSIVIVLVSGQVAAQEPELRVVTLATQWIPQSQFAGFYMAREKGIYAKNGLDVTIMPGGPESAPGVRLKSGEAHFMTSDLASALILRDKGVPLVNIAQLGQRTAQLLVARKSDGINTLKDLDGKRVSVWSTAETQPLALFRSQKMNVEVLLQGSTLNLFLRGGVSAASAKWYNEYHVLLNCGLDEEEMTVIHYDEYGLNFPEDGIYTLETLVQTDPDMCRRFAAASIEGWNYAFTHKQETLDVMMRYADAAHTGTNRVHQQWMLDRMKDIFMPPGGKTPMGRLQEKDYETTAQEMHACGFIQAVPAMKEMYAPVLFASN